MLLGPVWDPRWHGTWHEWSNMSWVIIFWIRL